MPIDATWTIGAKDRSKKALTSAGKGVDGFASKFSLFGKTAALGLGAAGLALGTFATKAVGNLIKTGDQFDKMAGRTGFTVEQLSGLEFALEQSGSSLATFERGARNLNKNLQDAAGGTATAAAKFKEIGVDIATLKDLSPDEVFNTVADAIAGIEDPAERAAAAGELLGQKAGPELLNLIKGGSAGIADLRGQAEELGRVMTTDTATAAAEAGDSLNTLKSALTGAALGAVSSLLPAVTSTAQALTERLKPILDKILPIFGELVSSLLPPLSVALDAVAIVVDTVLAPALGLLAELLDTKVGQALVVATGAVLALNAAAAANPYVLLAGAAVAAAAAIITHWEPISNFFTGLWESMRAIGSWVVDTFTRNWQWIAAIALGPLGVAIKLLIDNWDSVWGTMSRLGRWLEVGFVTSWNRARDAIRGAVNGIIGIVEGMANAVIGAINAVIGAWNSLDLTIPPIKISLPGPIPDINFGGLTLGLPDLPTLGQVSIPRLAQGGFVSRPTLAVVGDAPGGEYVIPARQMRRQAEPQTINLNVKLMLDGRALGQFTLNRVNEGIRSGEISAVAQLV